MQTKDIMTSDVVTIMPETRVRDIARLMLIHQISAVPVLDADGKIVGIVREEDLIHRVETGTEQHHVAWLTLQADLEERAHDYVKSHGMRAADVMTRDVESVRPQTPVNAVADLLGKRRVRNLPVIQEGKVVGMVSRVDLLRGLAGQAARPKAPGSVDDGTINKRLWQTLRSADWLNAASIQIAVKDGVVELWGWVDSDEQKLALGIAASSIPGVRAVEDHLVKIPAGAWAA